VLGTEPEIIKNYVETGLVRIVFWPMLDHGNASLNSHAAADCIGQQDVGAFWNIHDRFFQDQDDLWRADRDYFIDAAISAGVDEEAFKECFDSDVAHTRVSELDNLRREKGIFNRPTFTINGQLLVGSQPFNVFEQYIEAALP
jgi:protein-disulfide isomerase